MPAHTSGVNAGYARACFKRAVLFAHATGKQLRARLREWKRSGLRLSIRLYPVYTYNGVEYPNKRTIIWTTRGRCFAGVRPRVEHPDNLSFNWTHPVDQLDERPVELMMNSRRSRDSHGPIQYVQWSWVSKQTIIRLFRWRAPLSEASGQPVV